MAAFLAIWFLAPGCTTAPGSWDLLEPVARPQRPAPAPSASVEAAPPSEEQPSSADAGPGEAPGGTLRETAPSLSPFRDLASEEGAGTERDRATPPSDGVNAAGPVAPPEPPPLAEGPAPPVPPAASPFTPLEAPDWGLRLLVTLPDAQPPRAVLGLPDGQEIVVHPGQLLPELGLVVMAVGRDVAQLARVRPEGDHAKVEPVQLHALQPRNPLPAR